MQVIKVVLNYRILLVSVIILLMSACNSASFTEVYNGFSAQGYHARGMALNDSMLYTSGAKGKVTVFNLNQLAVSDTFSVPASDFRGIQYVSNHQLILMNSGDNGIVYQYDLKLKQFDTVLLDQGAFFDAISINSNGEGYIMGDPQNGEFVFYKTENYGQNWIKQKALPKPLKLEAGFAASNTGLAQFENQVVFATGASDTARLIKSINNGKAWEVVNTPLKSGDSFGIYSIRFWSANNGIIAGGSYVEKMEKDSILFFTKNGGQTWKNRSKGLPGYISCVTSNADASLIVATGRSGVYYSKNKGRQWELLTTQPFYTALINDKYICLSGQNGTLSIFRVPQ